MAIREKNNFIFNNYIIMEQKKETTNELEQLKKENAELKKQLEVEKLKAENKKLQEEIEEIRNPKPSVTL